MNPGALYPGTIGAISLLVHDYDAAIAFYVGKLGFALSEDTDMGGGKRWVRVTPKGGETSLLLARATTDAQRDWLTRTPSSSTMLRPTSSTLRILIPLSPSIPSSTSSRGHRQCHQQLKPWLNARFVI